MRDDAVKPYFKQPFPIGKGYKQCAWNDIGYNDKQASLERAPVGLLVEVKESEFRHLHAFLLQMEREHLYMVGVEPYFHQSAENKKHADHHEGMDKP